MKASLRWSGVSEFWSRYDLSKVVVSVGQLAGRNLLSLAISFGVAKILTSLFTREEYGIYQFAIGVVASLGFLSLPGLGPVIMQETAKGQHGALSRALKWQLRTGLIYTAAILLLAAYYQFVVRDTVLALCFAAASVFFPLKSAFESYQSYLLGRQDYALYARLPMFVNIFVALATAIAAWVGRTPVAVIVVVGAVTAACNAAAYGYALKARPPLNTNYSESAQRFGLGLSALRVTSSISSRLSTMLVGALFSMPEVAVLTLASMPLQKSKVLLGPLREVFGPKVISKSGPRLFRRANRVMLLYVSVLLGYVLIMVAAMPLLFRIFFPSYMDVVPLARLGMFCLLPSAPAGIMEMTIYSQERLKQTGAMYLVQFAFDLVIAFACIREWGVAGSFIGRFLAGLLRTGMVSVFYFRNRRQASKDVNSTSVIG